MVQCFLSFGAALPFISPILILMGRGVFHLPLLFFQFLQLRPYRGSIRLLL